MQINTLLENHAEEFGWHAKSIMILLATLICDEFRLSHPPRYCVQRKPDEKKP